MSEYTVVINRNAQKAALYRDGALKATWDKEYMVELVPYIESQVKAWVGASGDEVVYETAERPAGGYPESLKELFPPAPKAKAEKVVSEKSRPVSEED